MNDEAAFQKAMQENPEDNALRLVFADWLEEWGDPRGELIQLLYTLTQSVEVPDRSKLEVRLRGLLASGVQPVGPFWTNSIGMKFAWIPAGTFLMGSPEDEEGRSEDETKHQVTLTRGFWLAIHSVTQASWRTVMNNNPSPHKDDNLPVTRVSWKDCQHHLQRLSDIEYRQRSGGMGRDLYRLPTEAEWEYACRAGTTTPYHFGKNISTELARFGDVWSLPAAVATFPPNTFGLFDMHGNVWEWCSDYYDRYRKGDMVDPQGPGLGDWRVIRGGSYAETAKDQRSAARTSLPPVADILNINAGFRPVKYLP